jgi:hypothetical protein
MDPSTKGKLGELFRAVSWLLFGVAGFAFWVGGRAISEFGKTDRGLGEMGGLALAALLVGLGAVAKAAGDRFIDEENSASEDELARK